MINKNNVFIIYLLAFCFSISLFGQPSPTPVPALPGIVYASTGFADGGNLLTINPVTGAGTLVGPTGITDDIGFPAVPGLAINSRGEIFATNVSVSTSLYRVDAATGTGLFVANTGLPYVDAIAFDENDVLYGHTSGPTENLYTTDPATGAATLIGPSGAYIRGMAVDPTNGTLWGSGGAGRDTIYTIDKTTGAATVVGTTGLGGSTPDIFFDAAGNLFGSKGGGNSINDLISIDKTTGAGTVIGSIGFRAVAGLATAPGHPFVLLADKNIEIDRQVNSEGDIHANNDIEFEEGRPSTHTGNVNAVDDIKIEEKNTIDGDARAGDNIRNEGVVTGVVEDHAGIQKVDIPEVVVDAEGEDIDVDKHETVELDPGSYDDIKVDDYGTLVFRHDGNSGEYNMESLILKEKATLIVNVGNGAVTINVEDHLKFDEEVEVVILPNGEAGSRLVTFNFASDEDLDIEKKAKVLGTIIAPEAEVTLGRYSSFKGAICAETIKVKKGSTFLPHGSATPLPTSMPLLAGDQDNLGAEELNPIPTEYDLSQNFPNPFNPTTTLRFALPEASQVSLKIYNIRGQLVKTLVSAYTEAGIHQVVWNGRNEQGVQVASGMYIYRISAGSFIQTKKMILMK